MTTTVQRPGSTAAIRLAQKPARVAEKKIALYSGDRRMKLNTWQIGDKDVLPHKNKANFKRKTDIQKHSKHSTIVPGRTRKLSR